jgi:hypothetical protein
MPVDETFPLLQPRSAPYLVCSVAGFPLRDRHAKVAREDDRLLMDDRDGHPWNVERLANEIEPLLKLLDMSWPHDDVRLSESRVTCCH